MTIEKSAVLSALIDREEVDAEALAVALEDPVARSVLVDFVRVRAQIAEEFLPDDAAAHPVSRPGLAARRWVLRAAALLLPLLCGVAAGAWWVERRESRPPEPNRVVRFVQGVDWK